VCNKISFIMLLLLFISILTGAGAEVLDDVEKWDVNDGSIIEVNETTEPSTNGFGGDGAIGSEVVTIGGIARTGLTINQVEHGHFMYRLTWHGDEPGAITNDLPTEVPETMFFGLYLSPDEIDVGSRGLDSPDDFMLLSFAFSGSCNDGGRGIAIDLFHIRSVSVEAKNVGLFCYGEEEDWVRGDGTERWMGFAWTVHTMNPAEPFTLVLQPLEGWDVDGEQIPVATGLAMVVELLSDPRFEFDNDNSIGFELNDQIMFDEIEIGVGSDIIPSAEGYLKLADADEDNSKEDVDFIYVGLAMYLTFFGFLYIFFPRHVEHPVIKFVSIAVMWGAGLYFIQSFLNN